MIAYVTSLSIGWIAAVVAGQGAPPPPSVPSSPSAQAKAPISVAPLKVVVANPVIADILHAVGGEDVELIVLAGSGGDPHNYEPTPADAKQIASAGMVVQFGLGLDRSLEKLHASTQSKATLLVVANGLGRHGKQRGGVGKDDAHNHHHDHDHAHDHDPVQSDQESSAADSAGVDPHIWHDPTQVQVLNERLCAALIAARPQSADAFRSRSRTFDEQLVQLDGWIKAQVQTLAPSKRVIVTTHDGLRYFADRYGFQLVGIEMMGGGVAQTDPSPKELIKMVQALQAAKCSVVFGDSAHSTRVAATVAREANVRLLETLRLDGLLQPPTVEAGKAYLETMRANVKTIVEALNE